MSNNVTRHTTYINADDWDNLQVAYWNTIANKYDGLYKGKWSQLENMAIQKKLNKLQQIKHCKILDLGCGTGLGYELCKPHNEQLLYDGIDISPQMLEVARQKYPTARFRSGKMSDLSHLDEDYYDAVISLFGAFSYERDTTKVVKNIQLVLKHQGKVLVNAFSRFSLRRLMRAKLSSTEIYATRNVTQSQGVPVKVFTTTELRSIFAKHGFGDIHISGLGFFSGILEYNKLWKMDTLLCKLAPDFAHLITLEAQKL